MGEQRAGCATSLVSHETCEARPDRLALLGRYNPAIRLCPVLVADVLCEADASLIAVLGSPPRLSRAGKAWAVTHDGASQARR